MKKIALIPVGLAALALLFTVAVLFVKVVVEYAVYLWRLW